MKHVEERFGPETNKEVLLLCIGITSCIGRFIFGRAADYIPGVKKVYLQVSAVFFHADMQDLPFHSGLNRVRVSSRSMGPLLLEEGDGSQDLIQVKCSSFLLGKVLEAAPGLERSTGTICCCQLLHVGWSWTSEETPQLEALPE